jgi:hypothetical protein
MSIQSLHARKKATTAVAGAGDEEGNSSSTTGFGVEQGGATNGACGGNNVTALSTDSFHHRGHDKDHSSHHRRSGRIGAAALRRLTALAAGSNSREIQWALATVGTFLGFGLMLAFVLLSFHHEAVILDPLEVGPGVHANGIRGRAGFRHHFYTGKPRSVSVILPSVVNPQGRHDRLDAIQDTWGPFGMSKLSSFS